MLKVFKLTLISALAIGAQAQTNTNGLVNGRLWAGLSLGTSKSAFLLGFREGLKGGIEQLSACEPEKLQLAANIFPSRTVLSQDELVLSLDRFYEEAANRPIPIARALLYIGAQATGMKPGALADALADLRKEATAVAAKQ